MSNNKKVLLTDLPYQIYQSIADKLLPKDVINFRGTTKIFNKNVKKPKKLLHKNDIRNYLPESIVFNLNLDYQYTANEAKVLFLAKEINPNYDNDWYLHSEHGKMIKPTILKSGASEGDIIFAGDTYQTRQLYGFYIKTNEGFIHDNEQAYRGGPKGLIIFAKAKYPTKKYDNAIKLLNAWFRI